MYQINAHNISEKLGRYEKLAWCEKLGRNPNWGVVMTNYVCINYGYVMDLKGGQNIIIEG